MIRKLFCTGVLLFYFIENIEAQKVYEDRLIDSVKVSITQFFVKEGLLDKQKVGDSRDYVFATEIQKKRSIEYDSSGIYRIGVHQSHSPEHILIKYNKEFKIYNLEHINVVLKELVDYAERNSLNTEMMLAYIKEVIDLYHANHPQANFRVRKVH